MSCGEAVSSDDVLGGNARNNTMRNLICWWLGCETHPQEYCHRDDNIFHCMRCGEEASYSDLVGDTRHNRAREWARYWLWRKWWPEKCSDCGGRWKHDDTLDHLPF